MYPFVSLLSKTALFLFLMQLFPLRLNFLSSYIP
ncbi:unnamed protein product [Ectocarpus sp. 8 AP-2014]